MLLWIVNGEETDLGGLIAKLGSGKSGGGLFD
jgi:hypothetical protein